MTLTVDDILGKRYVCDFRVVAVGDRPVDGTDDDRLCSLLMYGEMYEISLGELRAMIEASFIIEAGPESTRH